MENTCDTLNFPPLHFGELNGLTETDSKSSLNLSTIRSDKLSNIKHLFTQPTIKYDDDNEYRISLCKMFQGKLNGLTEMETNNLSTLRSEDFSKSLNIEQEEGDELFFDEELLTENMEALFIYTKDNPLFQNLYDLAASKMFSTERTIGQCILFSYDYLSYYYSCIYVFVNTPLEFTKESKVYKDLVKMLK